MQSADFTTVLTVQQLPGDVFNAVNDPRAWWSLSIEGNTRQTGDVFYYHYQDVHRCTIKITALVPGKKVVWQVLDNYFKFTKDQAEWPGTSIIFDISEKDGNTQIQFTHQGLVPQHECYTICRDAWTNYIQHSLGSLITTGKGAPNAKDNPQTDAEKQFSTAAT